MARTAASQLSMKLGQRREEWVTELEGLLILAHLSLFLIQLIKALIRLTLTTSDNDELAAGEAEPGTRHTVNVAVDASGRRTQEGGGVVRGANGEVEDKAVYLCVILQQYGYSEFCS